MTSQEIFEGIRTGKLSAKEGKRLEEEKLKARGFVETRCFGWVSPEDYAEFEFLRRDHGIPVTDSFLEEESDEFETDAYGNRRKSKKKIKIGFTRLHTEYIRWAESVKYRDARASAAIVKDEMFDSLVKSFGGR